MCGRTASTLAPGDVVRASRYTNRRTGRRESPRWRTNPGQNYRTSYNIAPGGTTVLSLFSSQASDSSIKKIPPRLPTKGQRDRLAEAQPEGVPPRVSFLVQVGSQWATNQRKLFTVVSAVGPTDTILRISGGDEGSEQPVIVSSKHFHDSPPESSETEAQPEPDATERVIQPMRWGLVPSWHKGELKSFDLKTSNCRSDNMMSSRVFQTPLKKGRRCVVVVDGYYEWQAGKDKKQQPFFIYFPQETKDDKSVSDVKPAPDDGEDSVQAAEAETTDEEEWTGQKLLTMAGVFDICHPKDTEGKPFYTYSVVTVDASSSMSHIHHRMPAILNSDEEVRQWLDFGEVPLEQAISVIRPTSDVTSHTVSSVVNNSRNNTPDCVKKIDPNKKPNPTGLTMWLKKDGGKKKKEEDQGEKTEENVEDEKTEGEPEPKRLKKD